MAVKSSASALIAVRHSAKIEKPGFGMTKLRWRQILPFNGALTTQQIRCSRIDQVFEDNSRGIICYRDDRGEIICEGFDEGPCIRHLGPFSPHGRRDAEIIEMLQRTWLRIAESGNGNSSTLLEDVNCNGFNTLS